MFRTFHFTQPTVDSLELSDRVHFLYSVILVSRGDLPLKELVKRHRGKQGQENAFKGSLINLDLHHLPCRSFTANQMVYTCGQIAQLLLRAVQFQTDR